MARRHLCLLLLLFAQVCFAYGVWLKEVKPSGASWAILKFGVFSTGGKLKVVNPLKDCPQEKPLFAWVTHRLSPGETLSAQSAAKLAAELNATLGDCFDGIEIDAEPMLSLTPWFLEWAKALREKLDKKFALHAAIPVEWSPSMALVLLTVIDGIDLMIYDTGAKTPEQYQKYVAAALQLGLSVPQDKAVTFGFPAYPDKTHKHRPGVETLARVESLLKLQPALAKALCGPKRRVAVYAGWTMTAQEAKVAARMTGSSFCNK